LELGRVQGFKFGSASRGSGVWLSARVVRVTVRVRVRIKVKVRVRVRG
jgi:hypothetical protein